MTITLNGTTGITNDGGYTGDGVSFADTTPSNTLVTTTGGNVGVGTSSPDTKLQVSGTSGSPQFRAGTDTNGYFEVNAYDSNPVYCVVAGSNATAGVFGTQSNIPTVLFTNNTERMRIDNSGNVGIGTSSPSNLLQVSSTNSSVYTGLNLENKSTTGINSGVKIAWTQGGTVKSSINANTYGSDYMAFNVGSDTERMRISATGNIYVGADTTCDLSAFRSKSLASSGYQKLAGGLIMQWGFVTTNSTVTFPIAFPTQCFGVTFGAYGTESGIPRYTSVSTTSFVYSSASFGNQDAFWIAIGY